MLNTITSIDEKPAGEILTPEEMEKYKKFKLPLIPCQSCWGVSAPWENWQIILNTPLNENCVLHGCWKPLMFDDATKWYIKKDVKYLDTNINNTEHQEIIALFRDNLLWFCSHCDTSNINIPKDADWNHDLSEHVGCAWCGNTFNTEDDITPFMPIRNIWYNDGDDSNDTYEMKKLVELHAIWMRALKKAITIDNAKNNRKRVETIILANKLGKYLGNYRRVWRGRRDWNRAIQFLEEYLYSKDVAVQKRVKREASDSIQNSKRRVTNIIQSDLPLHNQVFDWYKSLDKKYQILFASPLLLSLTAISQDYDIEIKWAYHEISATKATKWTVPLEYKLRHKKPYVSLWRIYYKEIIDTNGQKRFQWYQAAQNEYDILTGKWSSKDELWNKGTVDYQLLISGQPQWKNKWRAKLKVWTEQRYVSKTCFDDTTSWWFSWGGSFWWSSSSGWSWMWTGSGWSLYFNEHNSIKLPWDNEIRNIPNPSISPIIKQAKASSQNLIYDPSEFQASVDEATVIKEIITTAIQKSLSLVIKDAMARECGGYQTFNVYEYADLDYLVQDYTVWDWKYFDKKTSWKKEWLDEESTLSTLKIESISDPYNQELQGVVVERFIKYLISWGKENFSKIKSRDDLKEMNNRLWDKCSIHKNWVMYLINGVTESDLYEQCLID